MGRKAKPAPRTRKAGRREPYPRVLIVCEGKKTEPYYFTGLRNHLRLSSANIEIVGGGGPPAKIIKRAEKLYREEKTAGNPFDEIFCVFDKEEHASYDRAINTLKQKNSGNRNDARWTAIVSVPAFEYWLLLHYRYTTSAYEKKERKSAGDVVTLALKEHCRDYQKNDKHIFEKFQDKLEEAKKNAKKCFDDTQTGKFKNPSTTVHLLVDFLQRIKDPRP